MLAFPQIWVLLSNRSIFVIIGINLDTGVLNTLSKNSRWDTNSEKN